MTNSFINLVCSDLRSKYGEEMQNHTLVFPGRRAILFFQKAWIEGKHSPSWIPNCITIQDLFASLDKKKYTIADDLALCVELFNLITEKYADVVGLNIISDFDLFYSWGNTVVADFDDIDKSMADAKKVFGHMKDNVDIRQDYLTDEQKSLLEEFFNISFADKEEMLEKFINLCASLHDIYTEYKEALDKKGIAYDGMRSRSVVEDETVEFDPDMHYSFIGFNVLNSVERRLFKKIGKARTHFYWDYDLLYTMPDEERIALQKKTNSLIAEFEAGKHIRENIRNYGGEIKDKTLFDNFNRTEKQVNYISASTDTAQAKYLASYLENLHANGEEEKETAIVLCDENMLLPVLHSIPNAYKDGEVPPINITMGYPLSLTPAGSLLKTMTSYQNYLQTYGGDTVTLKQLLPLVRHPYISLAHKKALDYAIEMQKNNHFFLKTKDLLDYQDEEGERIFSTLLAPVRNGNYNEYLDWLINELKFLATNKKLIAEPLMRESLYRAYTLVVRLKHTLSTLTGVSISTEMIGRLLTQLISSTTVPFHGEADKGLQIMGFLETRGLDFKNVCLLSASEGNLPPKASISSFIPQSIREAHGLTTVSNKSSIYAYYFYRLIQRASNVTILYNSTTSTTGSSGQMSRFMMQLLVDTDLPIKTLNIEAEIPSMTSQEIIVQKNEKIMESFSKYFDDSDAILSPSAINEYLDCPLKFYFDKVLKVSPRKEKEEMQATDIGTVFHSCMQHIYDSKKGMIVDKEYVKSYFDNNELISEIAVKYINEKFLHGKDYNESDYSGKMLVQKEIITTFIKKQLARDLRHCPFTYKDSEKRHKIDLELADGRKVKIGGDIDREDEKDSIPRVVDYKTGGTPCKKADFEKMFNSDIPYNSRPHYALQATIYAAIRFNELGKTTPVKPTLSYVNKLKINEDNDDQGAIDGISEIGAEEFTEFTGLLSELVSEIFNPNIPFTQTSCKDNCKYCDFKSFCRKS